MDPPLPPGPPPDRPPDVEPPQKDTEADKGNGDDGWEARFDEEKQEWYFYNRMTKVTTTENPRVPQAPVDPIAQELKNDPEFENLTKYEKYKRYVELKEKREQEEQEPEGKPDVEQHLNTMAKFEGDSTLADRDDPSDLMNIQGKGLSHRQQRAQAKVSKSDVKRFEKKKQERRKKQFDKWYREEEEPYQNRKQL